MCCKKPNVKNFEYHWHHMLQKYAGGSDSPDNLVRLRCYQHAMWHFAEWKRTGNIEDKVAWVCLRSVCQGDSHSERMRKLWEMPEYRKLWEEGSAQRVLDDIESGHFSKMGSKGGKAKTPKKAMSQLMPKRQRQLMVQNNPRLEEIQLKWVTLEHRSGTKFTTFVDTSLKPIIFRMQTLTGTRTAESKFTKVFTEGATVGGWKLIKVHSIRE